MSSQGTSSLVERPSLEELEYIKAMSRRSVIDAYAEWKVISKAEELCVDMAFRTGLSVLDLGCGAGRFAHYIGHEASLYLGIDASAEMIEAARNNYPSLAFQQNDIVKFDTDDSSWDVILLMGNVLDYLQPFERRTAVLRRCKNWLSDGGKIIGSSHLAKCGQVPGYYREDYHGACVENYRASLAENISEVEACGLEVIFAHRDFRNGSRADWFYWLAQRSLPAFR